MAPDKPKPEQAKAPTPVQLERLKAALRAADVARDCAKLTPTRPAVTYSKLTDGRSGNGRVISAPQ